MEIAPLDISDFPDLAAVLRSAAEGIGGEANIKPTATRAQRSNHTNSQNRQKGVSNQKRSSGAQKDKDREDYPTILGLCSQTLDALEQFYDIEREHAYELAYSSEFKERYEATRKDVYGRIKNFLGDLDILEDRNPEFATSEFASRRAELEAQQRSVEQQAQKEREAAGPPKPSATQMEQDLDNYQKLLHLYPQYLDSLEELYSIDRGKDPNAQQKFTQVRQGFIASIEDVRSKLDTLEGRNPVLVTDTSAALRAQLEERWEKLRKLPY